MGLCGQIACGAEASYIVIESRGDGKNACGGHLAKVVNDLFDDFETLKLEIIDLR